MSCEESGAKEKKRIKILPKDIEKHVKEKHVVSSNMSSKKSYNGPIKNSLGIHIKRQRKKSIKKKKPLPVPPALVGKRKDEEKHVTLPVKRKDEGKGVKRKDEEKKKKPVPPVKRKDGNKKKKIVIVAEKSEVTREYERKLENLKLNFECPITNETFKDPVILLESGQTYERKAIVDWLSEHDTDPLTNKKLQSKKLIENIALRAAIKDFHNS